MSAKVRFYIVTSWMMVVFCLVGWPTSMIWWLKDEPPGILSLSWAALLYAAMGVIVTVDVKKDQEQG